MGNQSGKRARRAPVPREPAQRQFIIISLFAIFINVLFQFLLSYLPSFHALARGVVETAAVALCILPLGFFYYLRPLTISVRERRSSDRTLLQSEMHDRIASELTTTFVFDLCVAHDGTISLDFLSDNFFSFAGRREEVRTFESLIGHVHPDDRGRLEECLGRMIARPQFTELECRAYIGEPRELKWLRICARSERDETQGRVTSIHGAVKDITGQKQAEEALRESEEKYRFLFDNEIYAVHVIDLETLRVLDANETFIRVYGYSRQDLSSGVTLLDLTLEKDASEKAIGQNRAGSSVYIPLRHHRKKDGTAFPVEIACAPLVWKKRKASFAIIHDISERMEAQENQARTQSLLEISQRLGHIGSWEYELSTGKLTWSDEMYRIAGLPVGSPVDLEVAESVFPPSELIRSRAATMSFVKTASTYGIDKRITRRDGQPRIIHTEGEVVRNAHGEALLVRGTTQDVTERKEIEEALRENQEKLRASESKYRKLIEAAPQAIYVVADEKIIFCNTHAHEMLGYSREEMLGMPMRVINHAEDWQQARQRYLSRAQGTRLTKSVSRHITKGGRSIWVECVGEQIEWEGTPAVLYFTSDITDRKNAESDRLEYEQYLGQAQRLESLGVLAGGIAHDFNNILTGIFGFAELAKSEAKDEVVSEYLSQAMESMGRAKALTQQLLTFATGGAPVRKTVPISQLIRETSEFALHGANIKGQYDIQENLWHCNVDKNQVAQVIQNLVLNAIQAMPMGGAIDITASNALVQRNQHPTLKEGNYVAISIKDQGTGIPEEMLSRIFDPFFTTKTKGHGLGLAISHSIMIRHGGAIDVASELGKGTTFTLYLPASAGSSEEASERPSFKHTGTGRILVMDDEEPLRELMSRMLESAGYSVTRKDNGKDTVDAFISAAGANDPFVAVILDLTIPGGMGGREVAQEIRKRDRDIPLFVASGYAGDSIMAHPTEHGFTASISKPFRSLELMEMLEKHLKKKQGNQIL